MPQLSEQTVQRRALQFLKEWYRKKARKGKMYLQAEVRTRLDYGGKRADGLLAFQHFWWGTTVVSMEAKSMKTLAAMKTQFDLSVFLLNCLRAGGLFCILSGCFFALFWMDDPMMRIFLPLNAFIVGAAAYGLLTFGSYRHKVAPVLNQLAEYPANERWLAFSRDSWRKLNREKRRELTKLCKAHRIGILLIDSGKRVLVWQRARRKRKLWGDFLKYYSNGSRIRQAIE